MEKVCILMSTYNGEKYLSEQLDSILNQENVEVDILIRDDGSTDKTLEILNEYSQKYSNIKYYTGKNIKSAKSFMELLFSVEDYDYYAFADQDDVWDNNKLYVAVSKLKEGYDLYGSKKKIVDSNLKSLNKKDEFPSKLSLGNAILRCRISGCTMVFNKKLRKIILKYKPKVISMHDSWILKVAVCTGKVFFDTSEYILYRQHGNNVVGAKKTFLKQIKEKILNFRKKKKDTLKRLIMAKEIYLNYKEFLSDENRLNLYYFINYRKKLKYRLNLFFSDFLIGDNFIDTFLIKLLILLGIF